MKQQRNPQLTDLENVKTFLLDLQQRICGQLSEIDGKEFIKDEWKHHSGGGGLTRVLEDSEIIEKGGVNFSHVRGAALPSSAMTERPHLVGSPFQAMGVSLVIHPRNPFAPTSHMNVRFIAVEKDDGIQHWWFGGGFDLTPCYGFTEDVVHWHQIAQSICNQFNPNAYAKYKRWCDEYFYIPHRNECRGVGGLFFDDLNQPGFQQCFDFIKAVGNGYLDAYLPILSKRHQQAYEDEHKQWQQIRRGRYVEFNLVYDRGTLFGLQSKGRTESILMSLPLNTGWRYQYKPQPDSEEQRLLTEFLPPKDWLA